MFENVELMSWDPPVGSPFLFTDQTRLHIVSDDFTGEITDFSIDDYNRDEAEAAGCLDLYEEMRSEVDKDLYPLYWICLRRLK